MVVSFDAKSYQLVYSLYPGRGLAAQQGFTPLSGSCLFQEHAPRQTLDIPVFEGPWNVPYADEPCVAMVFAKRLEASQFR